MYLTTASIAVSTKGIYKRYNIYLKIGFSCSASPMYSLPIILMTVAGNVTVLTARVAARSAPVAAAVVPVAVAAPAQAQQIGQPDQLRRAVVVVVVVDALGQLLQLKELLQRSRSGR